MVGGGGRVLLCAQRLYYGRDQLDRPPPNGLNHYLPLNKSGALSTGECFRFTMALLFSKKSAFVHPAKLTSGLLVQCDIYCPVGFCPSGLLSIPKYV